VVNEYTTDRYKNIEKIILNFIDKHSYDVEFKKESWTHAQKINCPKEGCYEYELISSNKDSGDVWISVSSLLEIYYCDISYQEYEGMEDVPNDNEFITDLLNTVAKGKIYEYRYFLRGIKVGHDITIEFDKFPNEHLRHTSILMKIFKPFCHSKQIFYKPWDIKKRKSINN